MKISYLIVCSTETDTLERLLSTITSILNDDELVILADRDNTGEGTQKILREIVTKFSYNIIEKRNIKIIENSLHNNYGSHKNFGIEKCSGEWIFQIDGDEIPSELTIGENLHAIIEKNPDIECFVVPRLNLYDGVEKKHSENWGWKLTPSSSIIKEKIIDTNSSEYIFLKTNGYILEEIKIN